MSCHFFKPEEIDKYNFNQKEESCLLASYALATVGLTKNSPDFKQVFLDYFEKFLFEYHSGLSIPELENKFVKSLSDSGGNSGINSSAKSMKIINEKLYGFTLKYFPDNPSELEQNEIMKKIIDENILTFAIMVLLSKKIENGIEKPVFQHYMPFGYFKYAGYYEGEYWGIDTSNGKIFKNAKYPRFNHTEFQNIFNGIYTYNGNPVTVGEVILLSKNSI